MFDVFILFRRLFKTVNFFETLGRNGFRNTYNTKILVSTHVFIDLLSLFYFIFFYFWGCHKVPDFIYCFLKSHLQTRVHFLRQLHDMLLLRLIRN